ncbi:MAG: protein kinase [Actinomycetia bacterium]|nr:protein kinase [Actinomycetes bacterium]
MIREGAGRAQSLRVKYSPTDHAHQPIAQAAQPPRLLSGRYALGPTIGRGGMGDVRRARDERLDRDVAVKLLRPDLAAHPTVRERFQHEAQAAARLSHPHIVTVFDTDEDDGDPFIVMECLSGLTLADELRAGPTSVERVRQLAMQVLSALSAAHRLGIVHRDIKPSNLLVCDDGTVKVGDFGIAKSADAFDHTSTGEVLGTVAYLAPERLEGQPATPLSDLYAVGVVLYEALAGRKPFEAETAVGVAYRAQSTEPARLHDIRPEADDSIITAVERAMAKHPKDRYRSADEMAAAISTAEVDGDATTIALRSDDTTRADATVPIDPATAVLRVAPTTDATPTAVPHSPTPKNRAALVLGAIVGIVAAAVIALLVHYNSGGSGSPARAGVPTTAATAAGNGSPTAPLAAPLAHAIDQLDQAVRP